VRNMKDGKKMPMPKKDMPKGKKDMPMKKGKC
jgi:hypothetical protein